MHIEFTKFSLNSRVRVLFMITWMQTNKKYLVATIWISVISFVAAGVVGWGEYNFSLTGKIASVGKVSITADDLNNEYGILYDEYDKEYRKVIGKPLDKEQASLLRLEEQAMNRLINKALMINFAMDYDLLVSDEEVARYIQEIPSFHDNGSYSVVLYREFLKRSRIKPSNYEERIREALLLDKIVKVFNSRPTPVEKIVFSLPDIIKDNIELKIVDVDSIRGNISDKELMDYFNDNKDNYVEDVFDVEEILISIDDIRVEESALKQYYEDNRSNYVKDNLVEEFSSIRDDVEADYKKREANKIALRTANNFKDGVKKVINSSQSTPSIVDALKVLKSGDVSEPIFIENKFVVLKLLGSKKNLKSYSEVKEAVYKDYKPIFNRKSMERYAESNLNLFKGVDVGYFKYNDDKRMYNFSDFEKKQLLQKIFSGTKSNGYIILGNRVVLYRILDQMIDKRLEFNNENLTNIKNNILDQTIVEFLKTKYKVVNNFNKGLI